MAPSLNPFVVPCNEFTTTQVSGQLFHLVTSRDRARPRSAQLAYVALSLILSAFSSRTSAQQSSAGQSLRSESADAAGLNIASSNDLAISATNGVLELRTEGEDPYLVFETLAPNVVAKQQILEMEYFCTSGMKRLQLRTGPPFQKEFVELPDVPPAEGWTTWTFNLSRHPQLLDKSSPLWRIDFGTRKGVKLQIKSLRVRDILPDEQRRLENAVRIRRQKELAAKQLADHYQKSMPAQIRSVHIGRERIVIEGIAGRRPPSSKIAIVVRPIPTRSSANPSEASLSNSKRVIEMDSDGTFRMKIAAFDWPDARAPGARFQLVDLNAGVALSHCRYADTFDSENDRRLSPPQTLQHAKGLTCITSQYQSAQLRQLGIKHNSVNITLNGLLSQSKRPGFESVVIRGREWFANAQKLSGLDRNVRTATDAGAVVAGILLIPYQAPKHLSLVHPEATSAGTYAMPNLTTTESVALYTATLDLLSDRYARPDNPHGRIDHWIVHNEVDYGWQWTNMGMQPIELFLDHYIKSMRLVDHCTRRVNPHAKTFISLTHRWNVPDDQPWKTYSPRAILRHLIRCCRAEGDFPWGIAYHPYPQSLWDSATWNDTQVSDDLDTRLITIRNLPVLQTFVDSAEAMTSDGKARSILLSEQGFHAPAQDTAALQRQCAALLYTFDQIRKCPSILAFDYHRPTDHPREGGLMLGLRSLATQSDPLGKPKPAWGIYRAIGTPDETSLRRQYEHHWQHADPHRQ